MDRPEKIWEMISMDLDNQLNKKEQGELQALLLQDAGIQKDYDALKAVVASLNEMPLVELPEGFHGELLEKLDQQQPEKVISLSEIRRKPLPFMGLAASFVLCLVMASSLFFPSESQNDMGRDATVSPQEADIRSYSENSIPEEDSFSIAQYDMGVAEEAEIAMDDAGEAMEQAALSGGMPYDAMTEKQATAAETAESSQQKLIKNKDITIQVKDFEAFTEEIKAIAGGAEGYVESFNSYVNQSDYGSSISGYFRIRIPAARYEAVTGEIQLLGTVLGESEYVDNITQQYYDVAGRLEIKLTERDKLLALLEESDAIQDIIALEERLSQVTYEIEAFETSLRDWDRQVAYSTIHIYAEDGLDVQIVPVQRDFGAKFYNNLTASVNHLRMGTENMVLWVAAHIIQIALIAVLGFLLVYFGRKIIRAKKL